MARDGKPTTLREVATVAGVSPATASVVLNGRDETVGISAATREAVLAAAERLRYRPNHAARALRRRQSNALALLISTFANPYFTDIATAARAAAEANRYELDVIDVGHSAAAVRALRHLRTGRADGAIIATGQRIFVDPVSEPLLDLVDHGLPMVMTLGYSPAPTVPAIRMDDEAGAYQATRHLLDLGHRRIAHLTATSSDLIADEWSPTASHDRFRGYRRALADAGVTFDPRWLVVVETSSADDGHQAARMLLARPHPRPTAAFVFNDVMALGVLRGLRHAGIRVPRDLAVIGFDGIDIGRFTAPELSTIDHPTAELGRRAVETLFGLLDGRKPPQDEIVLPLSLLIRESCGAVQTDGQQNLHRERS